MRILIITDKMQLGGAETHVFTLIEGLLKRGYEIGLMSAGGVYCERLAERGAKIIYAPLDRRTPASVIKSVKAIRRTMGLYDVIHAHTRFSAFAARLARGGSSFPAIVCTAHLTFRVRPFRKIAYWGEMTLAVSKDISNYLTREYKLPSEKIRITKNGIDTDYFKRSKPLNERNIVHVSRIDKDRSLCAFLLCDVASTLLREYKDRRIVIVGDGDDFQRLKRRAEEVNRVLGYEGVALIGATSDVKALLEDACLFVGVSRAALEAMSMELPSVICGNEGYGGIYTEDKFELLDSSNLCARGLPAAQSEVLYNDIKLLLDAPARAEEIGKAARAHVVDQYSSNSMTDDAVSLYGCVYRRMRPLLLGYIGYENFGDEAVYERVKQELYSRGIYDLRILIAPRKSDVKAKLYNRFSLIGVISAVRKSDTLILCGGNLMQNDTSLLSLIYYCTVISYAYQKGRSVYMLGSGFGEIYGAIGAFLVRRALEKVCYVGARTHTDLIELKHFAPSAKAEIMPDLCFLYKLHRSSATRKYFALIGTSKGFFDNIDVAAIEQKLGLTPIIILLFEAEDAPRAIEFGKTKGIECFLPKTPEELSRHLCSCRFSICERLHGAIFSLLCEAPSFLCDRTLKNRALIDEIGARCKRLDLASPLFPFGYAHGENAERIKKEIEAKSFDFQKIINSLSGDINIALQSIF